MHEMSCSGVLDTHVQSLGNSGTHRGRVDVTELPTYQRTSRLLGPAR